MSDMMDNKQSLGWGGFGVSSPQEVEELHKALAFTQSYADTLPGSFTGAPALQVESLDKTMRIVTHKEEDLLLWRDISKGPAYNTVEEFDTTRGYGTQIPGFFDMGTAPGAADSEYDRSVAQVKYIGIQKQINHDVMLVRPAHGPVVQREIKNGALWILAQLERYLFDADSAIWGKEFDGFKKQITVNSSLAKFKASAFSGYEGYGNDESSPLYDLRTAGVPQIIDEEAMEESALRQSNNFGSCTDMYLDTKAHSDFSRAFYGKERINTLGMEGKAGYVVRQFVSGAGTFNVKSGKFMRPRRRTLSQAVSSFGAPTIANLLHPASAASQFAAVDAGQYYYKVAAMYADGETLASTAEAVTVAAGNKVTIDITPAAGTPVFYLIFRSAKGAADGTLVEYIGRVANLGSGATHSVDYNAQMPGLSTGYLFQIDEDNMQFKQLLTMMKIDLALTGTQFKWMQLLYGVPMLFTPRKNTILLNIGRNS